MVIGYYADSLGLSRPGHVTLEERYIYLLEKWLKANHIEDLFIINRARRSLTIDKLYEIYKEDLEYITVEKELLIIHEGICDCAPRPVPPTLRRLISRLPVFLKSKIISFLHRKRGWLLKNGFAYYLTNSVKFERIIREWLTNAVSQYKRVYVLTIAPTNTDIEAHSPGFQNSIEKYNRIIRTVVAELGSSRLKLIDIHEMLLKVDVVNDYILKEDGHHITALTHKLIAEQLIQLEKPFLEHA